MSARRQPEPELVDRDEPSTATDTSSLIAINRAEIDGQIATARAFPRSVAAFIKEARALVSLDEETAEACIYSLPRGKNDRGEKNFITGPSVRFAEIIMHCFGNNRTGGRIVAEEREFIVAQGVFHDLEKNVQVTKEVRRRITDKYNKRYNADMIGVTGNAAISLALRNAIVAGIPKAIWLPIYEAARMVAVGDVTTLNQRRDLAIAWFAKVGVSPEQIFARLGVAGAEDIGLEELEALTGIKTAIRGGHVTPEAAFTPEPESAVPVATSKSAVADMAATLSKRNAGKQTPKDDGPTAQSVHDAIVAAQSLDALDEAADLIRSLPEPERLPLKVLYESRRDSFDLPQ